MGGSASGGQRSAKSQPYSASVCKTTKFDTRQRSEAGQAQAELQRGVQHNVYQSQSAHPRKATWSQGYASLTSASRVPGSYCKNVTIGALAGAVVALFMNRACTPAGGREIPVGDVEPTSTHNKRASREHLLQVGACGLGFVSSADTWRITKRPSLGDDAACLLRSWQHLGFSPGRLQGGICRSGKVRTERIFVFFMKTSVGRGPSGDRSVYLKGAKEHRLGSSYLNAHRARPKRTCPLTRVTRLTIPTSVPSIANCV